MPRGTLPGFRGELCQGSPQQILKGNPYLGVPQGSAAEDVSSETQPPLSNSFAQKKLEPLKPCRT